MCATRFVSSLIVFVFAAFSVTADVDGLPPVESYPTRVFWGDTHLHTSYSIDANIFGNSQLNPAAAYRFARGESVKGNSGQSAQLSRPLDFLAVTDHGEFLGLIPGILGNALELVGFERTGQWREALENKDVSRLMLLWAKGPEIVGDRVFAGPEFMARVWREYAAAADAYYSPGEFTTFIAYEWTGMEGMDNLHRNVLFADDQHRATQVLPFTSRDSQRPRDLWQFLADYESRTGGRAVAIPHNSNLSGGRMFRPQGIDGQLPSPEEARSRARWEPLVEITQTKGDSETHPLLSPRDQFADFGRWDTNLTMSAEVGKTAAEYPYDYVRSALTLGLQEQQRMGVNPFRFGVVGGTDSHTALATADEDNYWGKFSKDEPNVGRAVETVVPRSASDSNGIYANHRLLASGLTAVWAQNNTRESLFDALQRREVYASTGPRITVRLFAGWDFVEDDAGAELAAVGYGRGVPMGASLPPRLGNGAPRFLLGALRDPDGANLDRVQIVKGWIDRSGQRRQRVYDVLLSDERNADASGLVVPVGNSVDYASATYTNEIGGPALQGWWRDPDFDPAVPAYYYARVFEIPTPRWPLYDAVRFRGSVPPGANLVAQQRAYTSAIWYTPD